MASPKTEKAASKKIKNGSMKLAELVASDNALETLSKMQMKAKASYRIATAINQITPHIASFTQIQEDLINKYGEEVDGQVKVETESEHFPEFIREINDVLNEDVVVDVKKIKLKELGDVEVTPRDMLALGWLIEL